MDPAFLDNLTIDQLFDALERKVESTYRNPFSHSSDQAELTEVIHYIRRGTRILARIKNRHNAFSPIHRLPPEIFHRIFEQVQCKKRYDPIHWYYQREARTKAHTQWLVVTKVCHYWRAISFALPSLWCDTPVDPAWDDRSMQSWFLERSAPMSFLVCQDRWIQHPVDDTNAMIMNRSVLTGLHDSLSSCSERLQSIFLQFDQNSQDVIVKLLELPLPSLVNISLKYRHREVQGCALLPQVFRGQASRVRRLYLDHLWCWPANSETFKNLTHLILSFAPNSMLEVLIMLKACPCLEILHLCTAYFRSANVTLPTHLSRLPSPRLKALLSTGSVVKTLQLLPHLNLSPATSIYMEWVSSDKNVFFTLEQLDKARGTNFEHQVTTLEIQFGTQKTVCLHQNQLVLSVPSSVMHTLSSLSGHFPILRQIRFSVSDKHWGGPNDSKLKKREAELVYEKFLNGTPTLETIYFRTPDFEDELDLLMNAISRSSTLIEELRFTRASSQSERTEVVVERDPFPSYRLITEPRVPAVDVLPLFAGLELTEFVDPNTYDDL